MKVAYLINQYPSISHSFIRREIQALERQDVSVFRFSIRPSKDPLVAEEDRDEQKRTRTILTQSKIFLLKTASETFFQAPIRSLNAFFLSIRLGWRSERGLLRHFAYFIEALVLAASPDGDRQRTCALKLSPPEFLFCQHSRRGCPYRLWKR